jgi:hypothetical protein
MHRRSALLLALGLLAAAPAAAANRRVFATSIQGEGNLSLWSGAGGKSGVEAGDAICQARAAAGSLPNATTYRAWLSTADTDAYCHVQGLTGKKDDGCSAATPGGGPWYRVGGSEVSGTLDELTALENEIYRPVVVNEYGNPIAVDSSLSGLWTGTNAYGEASTWTCDDWTSDSDAFTGLTGDVWATAVAWTAETGYDCDQTARLLCLEPGASEPVEPFWSPAALVFTTSKTGKGGLSLWPEAHGETGLDAGDEICRTLAAAGFLPEPDSFSAWLSNGAVDARDRLTVAAPFRRVDGYLVASSEADLLDGEIMNSLHVDERGRYLPSQTNVWTGTLNDGTAALSHCSSWLVGTSGNGRTGTPVFAGSGRWTATTDGSCTGVNRLYCFSNTITIFWDGFEYTGDTSRWSDDSL